MIGPVTAVANGVTRTFSWRGRATRSEFWFYVLFCWIMTIALLFASGSIGSVAVVIIGDVVLLLMWFSVFSTMIRRLQDTGRSGAWVLIVLLPFIGGFWLLLLMTEPPQHHPNRFDTGGQPGSGLT